MRRFWRRAVLKAGPETDKQELQRGEVEFHENRDLQEPVPLAAVVTLGDLLKPDEADQSEDTTGASPSPKARLVVFGDSDFASNTYLGLSGNNDLFLNAVSWMAEEADLIAIRAKDQRLPHGSYRRTGKIRVLFDGNFSAASGDRLTSTVL